MSNKSDAQMVRGQLTAQSGFKCIIKVNSAQADGQKKDQKAKGNCKAPV